MDEQTDEQSSEQINEYQADEKREREQTDAWANEPYIDWPEDGLLGRCQTPGIKKK